MDRCIKSDEIILLFDRYTLESRLLHESIKQAGYECVAVVIEESDFLPKGVFSVYDLILGNYMHGVENSGKPKYYNEISVDDKWTINAGVNEGYGKITYQHVEKGRIFYAGTEKKYIVSALEWYDRKGIPRFRDHFNRYGDICARTIYDFQGRPMSKTWLSPQGKEIIIENFVTGDIILHDGEIVKLFRTKLDLFGYIFTQMGFNENQIFFNSLSTPFFISNLLEGSEKKDILFWQEPIQNEIPGNMQMILDGRASRTQKIMVQKNSSYEKLIALGAEKEMVHKLGFIYPFEKENHHKPEALICTNSDEIEHCRELVEALPQMHFHIAAITSMSPRLIELDAYKNVNLYPGAAGNVLDRLFQECDYYFDINHHAEIVSSVYKAFLHNQIIFAFQETVHSRDYVLDDNVYSVSEFKKMVLDIKKVMENEVVMKEYIEKQHGHALLENKDTFKKMIDA